ncbi:hypothetical protein D9M69_689850 [compost metagenome]
MADVISLSTSTASRGRSICNTQSALQRKAQISCWMFPAFCARDNNIKAVGSSALQSPR